MLYPNSGFTKFPNHLRAAWWKNKPKTVAVYFALRMNANHQPANWNGIVLASGDLCIGRKTLAAETGLSEQEVRTALSNLQKAGEITIRSTNKFSVISFTDKGNWGDDNGDSTSKSNDNQPAKNREITTVGEVETNNTRIVSPLYKNARTREPTMMGVSVPTVSEVQAYCDERNNGVDAQGFVDFYASKGWLIGTNPMQDWKAAVRTWERRDNY